jgi:hypothetical protein
LKLLENPVLSLAAARSDKDYDFYTNRCNGLNRQIDRLVSDLYGLTGHEIEILEDESCFFVSGWPTLS